MVPGLDAWAGSTRGKKSSNCMKEISLIVIVPQEAPEKMTDIV